ncbi:Hpt domain-containing protein [Sedimentitalea sp. JM2-8]|uniref:Hpt domain-containing protein n=1 Tax=Sedimentitalea xiamensis TaxID=3050037 RepID=A0ABT7F9I1_9RHOB|nr:Hpt domain-containing protein [Sedimentitalea xiamensis]MDK3071761.1 Hpt domain-containing protein [Sedimentitalea xiamensis]
MIEWSRVNELREEVGAEDFNEVVELFLEEVEGVIDRLRTDPDRSQLEDDMHFLKGSALSLGFSAFSKLCQTGEKLSSDGLSESVDVAEVIRCFEQSKTVFQSELQENLAA